MTIQDIRRRALATLIEKRWGNNARRFSLAIRKSDVQINDMLAGRKSFGEKVARDIETRAGLEPGTLDRSDAPATSQAAEPTPLPYLTEEARIVAEIYQALPGSARAEFSRAIVEAYTKIIVAHPEISSDGLARIIAITR